MRYVAPPREAIDRSLCDRLPLAAWAEYEQLCFGPSWPSVSELNALWPADASKTFVAQTPALLADGMHYEQRIAIAGQIATRESNWHDLFNALMWLRYRSIKCALNARQVAEIARMGIKKRSRAQYALTHFDEAGVIVVVRDRALLEMWDAHDWKALFWEHRDAWLSGAVDVELFGHALLELALTPGKLLVGKALAVCADRSVTAAEAVSHCARAITNGLALIDPLELRPLPLSGIPGWHVENQHEKFHRDAACYQPKRDGRSYPQPLVV